ncbi:hypothetical protein AVEN_62349-1 [Araneus ventricosus]|uniref:Uncharacterized protein n=1 Tax=Araneus ventricosus TaxID=182803 RepID=A0A4Y2K9D6_ARAVE|nr:hypothetical protein AVEN_62349-1 [Araneus ventricosus]
MRATGGKHRLMMKHSSASHRWYAPPDEAFEYKSPPPEEVFKCTYRHKRAERMTSEADQEEVNSVSPKPSQTAPFDRDRTQAVFDARVNFTGEKCFLSLCTIDRPNLGAVLLEFLQRKEGFHSVFVNENLLQFLRYWNSHSSRVQRVNTDFDKCLFNKFW